uniref:NLGase n=1 Tax=Oryza meridionalis TaxID=40149 RepID=A0A0E0EYT8_9ORYZ
MVSGNLFHCRRNSWPAEEYVGRTALQLLDFDGGSPPEQAWRRRLNSHANLLKEFSVTFMEAMRMMSLGLRLWSYVREEASHGRKAPIDPSGSISRGFRGEFKNWHIIPGLCETSPVMENQFSIFVSRDGGNKKYSSVLSPGHHEGLKKCNDSGISSWDWNLSGQHSTYHALFPRAWTVYDGEPDPDLKISCRQISPFIPHDYKDSSLPTSVFVYTLVNTGKDRAKVSLLMTWANSIGGFSHHSGGHFNEPFITAKDNPPVTFAIAACETQNVNVTVLPVFGLSGEGHDSAKQMWDRMKQNGHFDRENFEAGTSMPSSSGETLCAAVSASTWVEPHGRCTVVFGLAWSSPKIKFQKGCTYNRRYTEFYGTSERSAVNLVHDALTKYRIWEEEIEKWQNPILKNEKLPEWYKFTLFNELYFLVAGDGQPPIIDEKPSPGSNQQKSSKRGTRDTKQESVKDNHVKLTAEQVTNGGDLANGEERSVSKYAAVHGPQMAKATNGLGSQEPIPYLLSKNGPENVGKFLYLEGVEYIMWCTYDVHFYASFALLDLFPKIELSIQLCAAMDYMNQFDRDGDGLIENDGFPDQTYDAWTVHGISAYCGGLWLAALQAAATMAHRLGDRPFAEKYKLKFIQAKAVYEAKLWNGSYFNYDSGTSSNSRSIQADQLAGQWYAASSGLPPLFDENKIRSALQKIFEFNVMKVKGGRLGAVNGMTPNGKVDETCMQSREIWTGVTYGVAANMLLHGMEHQGFTTAEGIFIAGWSEEGYGYWFQTPEGWTIDGHYRSLIYMRPLAIWAMQWARSPPKAILDAPKVNLMDRIHLSPQMIRAMNEINVRKIAPDNRCFPSSAFRCEC